MSLEKIERVICDRYVSQGYAISRQNTKTLVVELPYGAQDFDEFVLDMRLNYGCKIDYDLTETAGKTVEIRITPNVHDIMVHTDSEDDGVASEPEEKEPVVNTKKKHKPKSSSNWMQLCFKGTLVCGGLMLLAVVFAVMLVKLDQPQIVKNAT
ncbi:MAG: hypothetical protein CL678_17530 [Bdellovibrionaceae bacterium]|nr:hypothetical protein [Pseudobdellovibrionaceae bacterium]|tara:strand:- start:1365 stop:1823 length:459 start_codon:yes stop_codon:yes gene_type:complete